jgi:predicted Zn-dependent protease
MHRAYEFMAQGDIAMEEQQPDAALKAYNSAEKLLPNNDEIKFWKAVALVNSNQVNASIPIFERLFLNDKRWQRILKRLPASELITIETTALDYLLKL